MPLSMEANYILPCFGFQHDLSENGFPLFFILNFNRYLINQAGQYLIFARE